jgi:hypothetical protein
MAAQEAQAAYKTLEQMDYNLEGYSPPERDSYSQSLASMGSAQISNLTPEDTHGIKTLLFRN